MNTPARRASRVAATLLVLTLAVGACSGDDEPDDAAAPDPQRTSTAAGALAVRTEVTLGQLTGKLPRVARKRLMTQVGDVVDRWTHAAYLGGDYPRQDFSDAWPGFTPGAKQEAHQDRTLMSNKDIGERIDGVEARRSRVRIDVLSVKKHPVGATARVLLAFRTTGSVQRDVRVQGRLYLTRTVHGWRVFGYDMTKGAV
jgi:hypothetical protein